jgi:nucleoside-diphosphate-sugar epimerase
VADVTVVAISGSSGLFGSAFLAKLPKELQISGSVKLRSLTTLEIYNEVEVLAAAGTKTFLHLAWPASSFVGNYRSSEENFEVLRKTIILEEACFEFGISFIGVGSVLDKVGDVKNYYHLTKFACRQMLDSQIQSESIAWIRPYYVFNNDSWPEFIHENKSLPVRILNNSPRDFIHLDDVVTGLFAIIKHGILGEIDLGSGLMTKPSELCDVLGKRYQIESEPSGEMIGSELLYSHQHPRLLEHWAPKTTHTLLKERK